MIYNPTKIKKLLEDIEEHLTEEEQEVVRQIVFNYNKLYILLKEKIEYVKRKESMYVLESNENDKLRMINKELKKSVEMYKEQNRFQRETIKELQKKKGG